MTTQINNKLPLLRIRLKVTKDTTLKKKRKRSTKSNNKSLKNTRKQHKKTNTVTLPTTLLNNNTTRSGYWTSEQVETNKLILRNCQFVTSQTV